jgi:cytochrome c oxidase subunit 1
MTAITPPSRPVSYLSDGVSLRSWLGTTDHKRIALLYLAAITVFFFIGGGAAVLIRLELVTPQGDVLSADSYNRAFTLHGMVMVWFFLIPSIPAVFGNFLLPLMIGAQDVAFARLNLASWYLFMAGGVIVLSVVLVGGVDTGWTFYTPYSSVYSNSYVLGALLGIVLSGFSSILTGINLITTTHMLRAPGMTWFRLPLFVWSIYATALILVLATPVLAITLVLVSAERVLGLGLFDPRLGGDPLLFQHLFWFYSHPAVYIMILPAMGVASELVTAFTRRPIFGYRFIAGSSLAIAALGFLVWGHHMFVAGQSVYASSVFSILSFLVAIPSGVKVYNWTATLYKGTITLAAPMIYFFGFIGLFVTGGLTGLFLAALALDVHVTDTYFVVAHFHFIMVGGSVSAYMGALHYWWPKMTGRLYPERLAQLAALLMFVGFLVTFLPQYWVGYLGMPRRYWSYPPELQVWNVLSSAGASILAAAYLLPLAYLGWSLLWGPRAAANPWRATGLEWSVASPPPRRNFAVPPQVTEPPYAYRDEDRP